ncbi:hypothetical protein ZWY2020_057274 [Hordeum vulgare]|nr:hypothetical protein ZWY2020_057274 [Hordeum vulgare]
MDVAIGTASGLIGSVLHQLSDEFIQAYVASSELGLNAKKIKDDLLFTQGLLHEAQRRGLSDNPGLQGLVQQLSAKADIAEDALDELHYFIIQDQLDDTNYAEPDLGDGLQGHARHGRHAVRYTVELQKATSPREPHPTSSECSSVKSISFTKSEMLTVDGFNPLITAVSVKELGIWNDENYPGSIAVDLLSEVAIRSKQLPAGSFQLEELRVDSISAVLVTPVCSHLAATLYKLIMFCDQRVESFTEEEEQALQLLTSLQILVIADCPGLPSLPQVLHTLSSLRELEVWDCPEIRSLPMGGLPTSLQKFKVRRCGYGLSEQAEILGESIPELRVITHCE